MTAMPDDVKLPAIEGDHRVKYDREALFPLICQEIAKGVTLREICRREGMPNYSVVYDWIKESEEFSQRFALARESGFDQIAEETLDIADNASNDWMEVNDPDNPGYKLNGEHVQRSKLRIETRLKLLAKWSPKKYGEKIDHNVDGSVTINVHRGGSRAADG